MSKENELDLSRRDFLKIIGGTAALLAFPSIVMNACKEQIQKVSSAVPVIWIQGQSCSGCSVSLLNSIKPDVPTLITQYISLNFHQTMSGGTGDSLIQVLTDAVKRKRKDYILVVEGSIPLAASSYCTLGLVNNKHVSIKDWLDQLSRHAKMIVAVGSCATFGGIPGARGNKTEAKSVMDIIKSKKVINIPGCPTHPDWIIGTLVHAIMLGMPDLDTYKRPKLYFSKTVHEQCEHLVAYKKGKFAQKWGDDGCLYMLGCLGIDTDCDIPKRKWLGVSSCTDCGSGCIGCTEKVFPDIGNRGLYMHKMAHNGASESEVS